uniref:Restriction endonuclease type IV Mrr domain-containing protein n=1 Tax=Megaviridae environmental sample TaxID=1737588 RepID=A0A5J6VH80_9VIRU|nr:MAG: hypothetical protein [Megaviridae environmental sample]
MFKVMPKFKPLVRAFCRFTPYDRTRRHIEYLNKATRGEYCVRVYKNLIRPTRNNKRDGTMFEEFFCDLLIVSKHATFAQVCGADTQGTSGDQGIDIKGQADGQTLFVQCKNTKKNIGVATLR